MEMKTTKGKLRNITSSILHTEIGDVYKFFEEYLSADGIMTHHLPSACRAIIPILRDKLTDEWFTNEWIKEGLDEVVEIPDLTDDEKDIFWESFGVHASRLWDNINDKLPDFGIILMTKQ